MTTKSQSSFDERWSQIAVKLVSDALRMKDSGEPVDNQVVLDSVRDTLRGKDNYIETAGETVEELRGVLGLIANVLHNIGDEEGKTRSARQTRGFWRWLITALAAVIGVLLLYADASLRHGFGQVLLEAAGGAILTFVLIDVLMHRIIALPDAELKKHQNQVQQWRDALSKAVANLQEAITKIPPPDAREAMLKETSR